MKDKLKQNNHLFTAYTLLEVDMNKEYKVNNIFNKDGITFNELISNFLLSFLDNDFKIQENNGIINTDIISNL